MAFYLPELKAQNWTFIRDHKGKLLSVLVCVDGIICSLGNSFQPVHALNSAYQISTRTNIDVGLC